MDMERTMQFIVETLADVAVRQQEAAVRAQAAERRADRADARIDKLERQMKGIQTLVKVGMRMLVESRQDHREIRKELKELAAAQKQTERALQKFLTGRNGSNGNHKRSN